MNTLIDQTITPRIYVASLADYNAGHLHGCWIDASERVETVREKIAEMLGRSRELIAEDWAIHDHEGFGDLRLSEFADLDRVTDAARLIIEHGSIFARLLNHFGGLCGIDEARQAMDDAYRGAFDSLADYAEELIEDCYASELKELPGFIRYRIDYEGIGDDLELGGDIFTIECGGKVHVFDAHL